MAAGMPDKCPKCKCENLEKERHPNGAQTGDWVCSECGDTGWIKTQHIDNPPEKNK